MDDTVIRIMNAFRRNVIVIAVFSLLAVSGILISVTTAPTPSSDEMVYLTGTLQAREGTLPDAEMLRAFDQAPYLYPHVLLFGYERLGYTLFKSLYLFILVLATGVAAYAMFRMMQLQFIPALILSVAAVMPRASAGQEIFGAITFHDAIGRASAVPLFFLATAFLLRRMTERKALWPVFGAIGFCVFLHPVTVTLFAFVALTATFISQLFRKDSFFRALRDLLLNGTAVLVAGSYFFAKAFERVAQGASSPQVTGTDYSAAILFRNAWEFPPESLRWYPHMLIVSFVFIILLAAFHSIPRLRDIVRANCLTSARELSVWGISVATGAIFFSAVIPLLNLYAMEYFNAPYVFQQWSRISKFYYLGLFVAVIPVAYALFQYYRDSLSPRRHVIATMLAIAVIGCSSFTFEVAQFALGYANYEQSYVPLALSGARGGITAAEYKDTCDALRQAGATSTSKIVSADFALRYYCRADLYVTNEELAAYQQISRADAVRWYKNLLAQRAALGSADVSAIRDFARSVGAAYVILPRTPKYVQLEHLIGSTLSETHIIMRIPPTP